DGGRHDEQILSGGGGGDVGQADVVAVVGAIADRVLLDLLHDQAVDEADGRGQDRGAFQKVCEGAHHPVVGAVVVDDHDLARLEQDGIGEHAAVDVIRRQLHAQRVRSAGQLHDAESVPVDAEPGEVIAHDVLVDKHGRNGSRAV